MEVYKSCRYWFEGLSCKKLDNRYCADISCPKHPDYKKDYPLSDKELKVTESAVRAAMEGCPEAKKVLKKLFGGQFSEKPFEPDEGLYGFFTGEGNQVSAVNLRLFAKIIGMFGRSNTVAISLLKAECINPNIIDYEKEYYSPFGTGTITIFVKDNRAQKIEIKREAQ